MLYFLIGLGYLFLLLLIKEVLRGKKPVFSAAVATSAFCLAAQVGAAAELVVSGLWGMGVAAMAFLFINAIASMK